MVPCWWWATLSLSLVGVVVVGSLLVLGPSLSRCSWWWLVRCCAWVHSSLLQFAATLTGSRGPGPGFPQKQKQLKQLFCGSLGLPGGGSKYIKYLKHIFCRSPGSTPLAPTTSVEYVCIFVFWRTPHPRAPILLQHQKSLNSLETLFSGSLGVPG